MRVLIILLVIISSAQAVTMSRSQHIRYTNMYKQAIIDLQRGAEITVSYYDNGRTHTYKLTEAICRARIAEARPRTY